MVDLDFLDRDLRQAVPAVDLRVSDASSWEVDLLLFELIGLAAVPAVDLSVLVTAAGPVWVLLVDWDGLVALRAVDLGRGIHCVRVARLLLLGVVLSAAVPAVNLALLLRIHARVVDLNFLDRNLLQTVPAVDLRVSIASSWEVDLLKVKLVGLSASFAVNLRLLVSVGN